MIKILSLIIIYKEVPDETTTIKSIKSLIKEDGIEISSILWDNSPYDFNKFNCDYHTPVNTPLSVIYNTVIKKNLNKYDYLLILDQDTKIPENFLKKLKESINKNPFTDLFLPIIKLENKIFSPINYSFGWGMPFKNNPIGRIEAKNIVAINSGMVISKKFLQGDFKGYDEKLSFYGTDTKFMIDYSKLRSNLVVLDCTFHHSLSFFESSIEDKVKKFKEIKKCTLYIHSKEKTLNLIVTKFALNFLSLVYALRYRHIDFLKK